MKYSDEQIKAQENLLAIAGSMTNRELCRGEEHPVASYCRDASEIIEQLRANLAEVNARLRPATETNLEANAMRAYEGEYQAWKSGMLSIPECAEHLASRYIPWLIADFRADIERKRAKIAALPSPFMLVLGEKQRPYISKDDVLAILDDKEAPHA